MGTSWSSNTAAYLEATTGCPRCDELLDGSGVCRECRADLRGDEAVAVYAASLAAAEAIRTRQRLINALPSVQALEPARTSGPVQAPPAPAPEVSFPLFPPLRAPQSRVSVQSVLAVAGAGLFAVAAFVFTHLNPDLTDFATRSTIVGVVTALFLGTAWLLARAGLRFSAESVGALGVVFLGLDVTAIATGVPGPATAGTALLAASTVLLVIATLAGLRTWLLASLVGLVVAPMFFSLPDSVALLAVGAAAVLAHEGATRLAPRFDGTLRAEHRVATALQVVAGIGLLGSFATTTEPFVPGSVLPAAAAIAALATLAALATRYGHRVAWSVATSALAALAALTASLALPLQDGPWLIAVAPAVVGLSALVLAAAAPLPLARSIDRRALLLGGWSALLIAGVPALYAATTLVATAPFGLLDREWGGAAITGVAVTALASLGIGLLARRVRTTPDVAPATAAPITAAVWLGALTLVAIAGWSAWLPATQLVIALALAIGLTLGHLRTRDASWASCLRTPAILAAHVLVLLAIAIAAVDPSLAVVGGIAIVPTILMLARSFPPAGRAVHAGVAYAYGLFVLARALDAVALDTIGILCITTAVASVVAFTATTVQRLHVRYWYAILVVTTVPFLLGVASVLLERSGWTALSTALILSLAISLVITQRTGLTMLVRTAAASVIVPSLAVVVVCLGAALLQSSGSPVALPVIAAIVAATLPLTGIGREYLEQRGIGSGDARAARISVEVSTLATAAIAVLLSLSREAAGLETTFLVLTIIGIGGIAGGLFVKRRLFWIVAAAGFTGALWTLLAIGEVSTVEPYILPPALAAIVIGARSVARSGAGHWLFVAGLGAGIIPSLALLAMGERAAGTVDPSAVRTAALLAAAVLLIALTGRFGRVVRLASLRIPTLLAVIVAAGAGAVQGVAWGLGTTAWSTEERSWSILALGVAAALLAGYAGWAIARLSPSLSATRALLVPAALYLVVGSMAGIRMAPLPVVVLIALMTVLLIVLLVSVWRGLDGATALPPVWVLFGLAWVTAVVAWSPRELLRVEAFSLPLGLFLLAAGAIVLRRPARSGHRSWPIGHEGSWRLLSPGILVTLVPSVLATATDPRTERAILVIAIALVAILLGSLLRLAAPFVLGILVLPIENVIVFAVQIGRQIESAPWWITLATAGATLLVIAVTSERRGRGVAGVGAQLRDLA